MDHTANKPCSCVVCVAGRESLRMAEAVSRAVAEGDHVTVAIKVPRAYYKWFTPDTGLDPTQALTAILATSDFWSNAGTVDQGVRAEQARLVRAAMPPMSADALRALLAILSKGAQS